jgi:hypothetical protein
VNFVESISPTNKEKGLAELSIWLKAILNECPDVEFMSSHELLNLV